MPGLAVVAAVTPDNTPHGYDLTFAVPVGLFAVVAVALYLLFSRPHRRIPARAAGLADAGLADAVPVGAGLADAGLADAGLADASPVDAGPVDASPVDAGPIDASPVDAGPVEAGAGPPDGDGPAPAEHAEDGQ
jgi:hypothetical protein